MDLGLLVSPGVLHLSDEDRASLVRGLLERGQTSLAAFVASPSGSTGWDMYWWSSGGPSGLVHWERTPGFVLEALADVDAPITFGGGLLLRVEVGGFLIWERPGDRCPHCGAPDSVFLAEHSRRCLGWGVTRSSRIKWDRRYRAFGEVRTLGEWVIDRRRGRGVTISMVVKRVRARWALEDALVLPHGARRSRPFKPLEVV